MDKLEYREKLEELTSYVNDKDYEKALPIVEEIDWRRVKSSKTLSMVADVYDAVKKYEDAQRILKLALTRSSIGRNILSKLVEVSLKLGQLNEAEDYFDQFVKVAGDDNYRYVLQYRIFKAKKAPLDAQIALLEEYREKEYTEKWAYELANLYDINGEQDKCVTACDDLILWFGNGKYVMKAMDLKLKYQPLSSEQKKAYATARNAGTTEKKAEKEAAAEKKERKSAPISDTLRVQGERTVDRDDLKKSIRSVFQGIREDRTSYKERDTEDIRLDNTVPLDMLNISDLEPEVKDQTVISLSDNPDAFTQMSAQESAVRAETASKVENFDLDALLKETAGAFSEEITTGNFSSEAVEVEKPEVAAPTAEEVAEFKAAIKTAEGKEVETVPADSAKDIVVKKTDSRFDIGRSRPSRKRGSMDDRIAAILNSLEEPKKEEVPVEAAPATVSVAEALEKVTEVALSDTPVAIEEVIPIPETLVEKEETPVAEVKEETTAEKAEVKEESVAEAKEEAPKKVSYNEELEIPDEEVSPKEALSFSRTINLDKVGQNTVPISLDELLKVETPEERRIRILNNARPTKMNDEQRKVFTYFARIPGMDSQILEAINGVYAHAGENTSKHGNIGVMGARGTGKSKLTENLVLTMCKDLQMNAAKIARVNGKAMNTKNPVEVVAKMAGGFLMIEDCGLMKPEIVDALNKAMEFRTDCMILILEDEKASMRAFLKKYPEFAEKIDKVISIPVFTNDELVTFARTYATENGCEMDDMGVLALYTIIGNKQSFEEPMTISKVKTIMDGAIASAKSNSGRRFGRRRRKTVNGVVIIQEKDFDNN